MSVDRLSLADRHVLCRVHDDEAANRQPPRTFHGWYAIDAANLRRCDWDIRPDKTPVNKWHAEVFLPTTLDQDSWLDNCLTVASYSNWEPRPMSAADEEFLDTIGAEL